jgi:polygalacturonase
VEISGVTLKDSPTWTLVFHNSDFINIHHIRVENDLRIPNNDGIHCCGCRDVIISNSFFCCGDDCIAITSISDGEIVSERFVISDCIFKSVSAAIRIGFQDSKVRDVLLQNCIIRESNRGIAVFAGKNGFVENIRMNNLIIDCRIYAGYWWGKGEPLVLCSAEKESRIRNIFLNNAQIRAENSIIVSGTDGSISGVVLENLQIQLNYGSRRPWFGKEIDLSPHPRKAALPAEKQIPWLWSDGRSGIQWQNIRHFCKEDSVHLFDTAEVLI